MSSESSYLSPECIAYELTSLENFHSIYEHVGTVYKDQANWGTAKSDYGRAIGEVVHFYNLYSTQDKMLAPDPKKPYSPYQIYPSAEADSALGQSGYQKDPDTILILTGDLSVLKSLPRNYNKKNVTDQILAICDADADKKPDLPFFPGKIIGIGDNHGGYMGFRDIANKSKLIDAGAMDIVVHDWDNKTIIDNNENLNSTVKCKSQSLIYFANSPI